MEEICDRNAFITYRWRKWNLRLSNIVAEDRNAILWKQMKTKWDGKMERNANPRILRHPRSGNRPWTSAKVVSQARVKLQSPHYFSI